MRDQKFPAQKYDGLEKIVLEFLAAVRKRSRRRASAVPGRCVTTG